MPSARTALVILGVAALGCTEVHMPVGDLLVAEHNWQPPPPDKLQCRGGPLIRVMVETRAFIQDSGGYLGCTYTYPGESGPRENGSEVLLTLEASARHLTLTTTRARSVYYFLVARSAADTMTWSPCVEPSRCRRVSRGESVRIPYDKIAGWVRGEPQVVVYAWRLTPAEQGGHRPDRVRAVAIEVQSPDPTRPKR